MFQESPIHIFETFPCYRELPLHWLHMEVRKHLPAEQILILYPSGDKTFLLVPILLTLKYPEINLHPES